MDIEKLSRELLSIRLDYLRAIDNGDVARLARGELFVLNFLRERGGTAFPVEISEAMSVSTARVAVMLKSMKNKGWIERRADESDGRYISVTITKEGREELDAVYTEAISKMRRVLEFLGEDDAGELLRIQRRIIGEFNHRY
ncbi:MAG: MarR family transcriptional regulator [Clostridia bacterium]|nr:MarR family transcriptional regulator [Clostridia bacterium]MBQ1375873.1 MarR family transcriptional regulator [Clostridia bacterium]